MKELLGAIAIAAALIFAFRSKAEAASNGNSARDPNVSGMKAPPDVCVWLDSNNVWRYGCDTAEKGFTPERFVCGRTQDGNPKLCFTDASGLIHGPFAEETPNPFARPGVF